MEQGNTIRNHIGTNQQADLLDILKRNLHCTYISDLRIEPFNSHAKVLLEQMDLGQYTNKQIGDTFKYVYAAA